jgi:hypothetical protein
MRRSARQGWQIRSHRADFGLGIFGLSMMSHPHRPEEGRLLQRLAPVIGLLVVLVPAARAQVNIDQGKSAAEIFANDCAACHKTTRGLATGKNSLMLASFLREHYTASREQAASLAAYVLGAGGAEKPAQKPGSERAKVEEPKGAAHPTQQTAKPEVEAPTAKLQPPAGEEAKPEEPRPAPTARGRKPDHEATAPAPEPAPVAAPPANETPAPGVSPTTSAAAPAAVVTPGEDEPVPRDNIPD